MDLFRSLVNLEGEKALSWRVMEYWIVKDVGRKLSHCASVHDRGIYLKNLRKTTINLRDIQYSFRDLDIVPCRYPSGVLATRPCLSSWFIARCSFTRVGTL